MTHRLLQLAGDLLRLLRAGGRQQGDEAVAGQAAEQILAAQVEQQQLGQALQHPIALGVAMLAVETAETVQIENRQGQRLALFAALLQGLLHLQAQVVGGAQRLSLIHI